VHRGNTEPAERVGLAKVRAGRVDDDDRPHWSSGPLAGCAM
jgi:hypothetical protein